MPNHCTSSMCDSQVSGCQFDAWPEVNAQTTPSTVRPRDTIGFSVT